MNASSASKPSLPPIPNQIGPYKIENMLKKGGMSLLYLGSTSDSKKPVIIKVLLEKYRSNNEVVQRFLREAEIIAIADHPNIVKMYGQGVWEGGYYIAMEYIMGCSLRQHLLQTPLALRRALEIVLEISYAVCHLHAHGIVHSDLKPENILLTDKGKVKVIDFGIAQLTEEQNGQAKEGSVTRTVGTPIYMSPEQLEGTTAVSYPSDIYSLGIIAYELLLGRLSHGQLHLALMPKGMQKILFQALQPKPQDRYADIADFISDVSGYLHSPELERERNVTDRLSEFAENLHLAQALIYIPPPKHWECFESGVATYSPTELIGSYGEFLTLGRGERALLLGESSLAKAEGMIASAVVRGIVHTLLQVEPHRSSASLFDDLNNALFHEKLSLDFHCCCLFLNSKKKSLQFLSCGFGSAWHYDSSSGAVQLLGAEHPPLGLALDQQFRPFSSRLKKNDLILLLGVAGSLLMQSENHPSIGSAVEEWIVKYADLAPQEIAQAILLKLQFQVGKIPLRVFAFRVSNTLVLEDE